MHKCTVLTFVFVLQMSSSHCNKTNFERKYTDLSHSAAERTRQCLTLYATARL